MADKQVTFGPGLDGIISGASGQRGPVIITHGAGRGMDATLLVKTADRLAEAGFVVLRFNFGYLGKRPAPSQGGRNERPELTAAIEYMKEYGKPVLIGKSFGARVSSHVASERDDIRALVFYGLPLQGMSKSSKPRDWSHLAKIKAPTLFITGNKDTLSPLPELNKVLPLVTSHCTSQVVPGDHSFKPKSEDAAVDLCCSWVEQLD